jgi:uncharacterized repeat protein (TIGR01451 family)
MSTTRSSFALAAAVGALLVAGAASAQDKGCVELKTAAEVEQQYVDEQGRRATRLVPANKVVPGDEVVWTITARNVCQQPAERVAIANPVPEHMAYVANSALGIGTQISYSVDGQQFRPAGELSVADNGVERPARAEDYRAVRWAYATAFAPGATAFVRYRAVVK